MLVFYSEIGRVILTLEKEATATVKQTSSLSGVARNNWRPVILMVLVVASWASATVVTKHLLAKNLAVPLAVVAWRFALAGTFALLIFAIGQRRRGTKKLPLVGKWPVYLFGGALITTFIVGFNLALLYITATLGGLVFFGLNTVVMIGVGHFWFGTGFGRFQIYGIVLALLGMAFTVSGGNWNHLVASLTGSNLPLGLLLMAIASVGWGMYGLWGRRYTGKLPGTSLLSTGLNQLIGVIPVWLIMLVTDPGNLFPSQAEAWISILYIGIVPSALGFALFYAILKDLTLNQAATIQLFSPVFTGLMAIMFLGEPFSLALLVGAGMVLIGVRISSQIRR